MSHSPDTIVAISTPPGRGGIGIVRLSGPRALEIASPLLRLRHPLAPNQARFAEVLDLGPAPNSVILSDPQRAQRVEGESKDPARLSPATTLHTVLPTPPPPPASNLEPHTSHPILDQAVATYFAAPHSYTGEDIVEIAAHGSPVLLETIVRQCCAGGARLAEPGEFTQRAFLAGRIDLTQAEAVHDLIASSTLEQARLAARQLSGSLAHAIAPIKSQLVALIATLEAGIDFAEDDIDVLPASAITARIAAIAAPLQALERTFRYGRVVRDGFRLAIVGRPNAGKSSLFNRLVERDRAIVTAAPGTTRDLVTETVAIEGVPVHLVDTAGLREAADEAERLGIAKSHQAMADADLVLLVLDAPALAAAGQLPPEDKAVIQRAAGCPVLAPLGLPCPVEGSTPTPVILSEERSDESKDPHPASPRPIPTPVSASDPLLPTTTTLLLALNKIDLLPNPLQSTAHLADLLQKELQIENHNRDAANSALPASNLPPGASNLIPTSALTSAGLPELRAAILAALAGPAAASRESALLTNLRQHQAVAESLRALAAARAAVAAHIPHEMLLVDLYAALRALDTLTGATTTEDLLQLIFSTFCIGK